MNIKTGQLPGYFFPKLIKMGELIINPFNKDSLGNICYYLHFNNRFRKPVKNNTPVNLLSKESINNAFEPYEEMDDYVLMPKESVIAQTHEKVGISRWFLAKLENTSSLGRVFINQASHGYLHPGHGIKEPFRLMIEITNLSEKPIRIIPEKTQCMRMYLEKLPYKAVEYESVSSVPKLKMNIGDKS